MVLVMFGKVNIFSGEYDIFSGILEFSLKSIQFFIMADWTYF